MLIVALFILLSVSNLYYMGRVVQLKEGHTTLAPIIPSTEKIDEFLDQVEHRIRWSKCTMHEEERVRLIIDKAKADCGIIHIPKRIHE